MGLALLPKLIVITRWNAGFFEALAVVLENEQARQLTQGSKARESVVAYGATYFDRPGRRGEPHTSATDATTGAASFQAVDHHPALLQGDQWNAAYRKTGRSGSGDHGPPSAYR